MAVRFDPLGARWRGRRERQIEDRHPLSARPAPADRHDFVSGGEIDAFDGHWHTEDLGLEGKREIVFQHREEARALLGLSIGVDDRLLDELF